jgi:hypothetical protein
VGVLKYGWIAGLIAVGCIALIAANYVRYGLIEPASVGAFCETAITDVACQIRSAIIALLSEQRLGWLAVVAALLALVFGVQTIGWIAWFLACTGFVLYHAELAAPALLLAGVALVRSRQRVQNWRRGQ